jgi:hypothetical protein
MRVDSVDERKSTQRDPKNTKKVIERNFQILTGVNVANQPVTLYSWHTGETWDRIKAIPPKSNCIFVVKPQKSGENTYYNVQSIEEITGETAPSQGELMPPEEDFN